MNSQPPLLLLFLLIAHLGYSQITGTVSDSLNQPLSYVNIYTEDGTRGTTTNESGDFELKTTTPGTYHLVFQFLGYETRRMAVEVQKFPHQLNIELTPETTSLEEVTITAGENPADKIIRYAIDSRKDNLVKIQKYTADYYSRGLWRIKNAPEKILGQEVGDLGGGLDSTRSGIVYLSETISEIAYRAPDDFKEKILASKVSGNDNGFSLNSAQESDFSFYNNTIEINAAIISPIADYAFNYYDYQLTSGFYDDRGNLINKILVTPKRPKDRVFSGYLYIVEDTWQIYGVELETTGEAVQVPPIETLTFTQNFKYSEAHNFWVKISQTVDFNFSMFGISGDGRFTAVYSKYNFDPDLESAFSREVLSFSQAANKKDSLYWKNLRPVPLTTEEVTDYVRKDSIQKVRDSKPYQDSIDHVRNRFQVGDLLTGYSFTNSYKNQFFHISGPLLGTHFNTVQGWNSSTTLSFRKNQGKDYGRYWRVFGRVNYGFSEQRLRVTGGFQRKFNNFSKPVLTLSGGVEAAQINDVQPISARINDVTSLLFERNYLKLYQRKFAEIGWQQEILNGFSLHSRISFQERLPLFNTTDQTWRNLEDKEYTSNNPLQPEAFDSAPFKQHQIFKLTMAGQINFAQKYMTYPDEKYNVRSNKFPTLHLAYEKGFGSTIKSYNFDHFQAALRQNLQLGNKGSFSYNLKGGSFLQGENISFLDYRHFNGNQTRVGNGNYTNTFHLLPYYAHSTNKTYAEGHFEQDFKGWILGKIPGLNQLNFNLVLGAHILSTEDHKPYTEYSAGLDNLGFGKYRLLRIDYVISEFEGKRQGAFIFGLKFLGIVE